MDTKLAPTYSAILARAALGQSPATIAAFYGVGVEWVETILRTDAAQAVLPREGAR